MKKIHIISHTHWDREWYLNSKYTNEWLVDFFEGLFAMLDKEPDYQFVLDGQTMILEDYYVEVRKRGLSVSERKEKLKKYVSSGRIFIGPMYCQPDWQLCSEESLVKNLVLGNEISKKYGKRMSVGWLLDNFGQISQTSQILKHANLKGLYVWRGVEMDPNNVHSEFLWESPDGTKLPSVYLLDSYRNGMRLAEYEEIFDARMADMYKRLLPFTTTSNILILNGYDQEIEPDDVLSVIRNNKKDTDKYVLEQSNPVKYMESIVSEEPKLQTLKGALYSGRFISVFPGVLSARMYLKQQNHKSEKLIEKQVEPLSMMNFLTGGEYGSNHINAAYKKLLMNQPHDSICGCSIDDVHKDMEVRTDLVDTMLNDEIDTTMSELLSKIDTTNSYKGKGLVVVNTASYKKDITFVKDEVITVKDVPAFGYRVVTENEQLNNTVKLDEENSVIENNFIKITINKNGTVDLYDKENEYLYNELGLLKDKADAGDEYNYSFPDVDKVLTTEDIQADISYELVNEKLVIVQVKYDFIIPKEITNDRKERTSEIIKMPVTTYIKVYANSSRVEFETDILNTAKNHIVSVVFKTKLDTETSQAGAQFDVVTRDISYDDFDESEIPKHVREVIIGAREPKPNRIFPHREFVDLSDKSKGLAVLNKGLPEFTVNEEDNAIELTLFRSVEWVANDINSRLGDAGPKIFAPDAQCLRQMKFNYAVYPHKGDYIVGKVVKEADAYNTDPIIFKTEEAKGLLPQTYNFITINDNSFNIKVTGFKRSLDKKALVLRVYNSGNEDVSFSLSSSLDVLNLSETNFIEENESNIANNVVLKKKEIKTIKVYLRHINLISTNSYVNKLDNTIKEDYSNYPMCDYVSLQDIKLELERADELKPLVNTPDMGRTALEAQLSAVLTNTRKEEVIIRELGYKLNKARVVRRVWDYIKTYKD